MAAFSLRSSNLPFALRPGPSHQTWLDNHFRLLTYLQLGNNELQTISVYISQLVNLKTLHVRFMHGVCLTFIQLNNNHLTEFPEGLVALTNLTVLSVSAALFPTFAFFASSSTLRLLRLSHTLHLPRNPSTPALRLIRCLTPLQISCNQISSIPESISRLHNLTAFEISNNKITKLPRGFAYLTSLSTALGVRANNHKQTDINTRNPTN